MTIYTDRVTGKKYDRVRRGVSVAGVTSGGSIGCRECAFDADITQCHRAVEHCVSRAPGKTVFFVFKERKV